MRKHATPPPLVVTSHAFKIWKGANSCRTGGLDDFGRDLSP